MCFAGPGQLAAGHRYLCSPMGLAAAQMLVDPTSARAHGNSVSGQTVERRHPIPLSAGVSRRGEPLQRSAAILAHGLCSCTNARVENAHGTYMNTTVYRIISVRSFFPRAGQWLLQDLGLAEDITQCASARENATARQEGYRYHEMLYPK